MGGSGSEEFMVPSKVGEEEIIKCSKCDYVANVELAKSYYEFKVEDVPLLPLEEVYTPDSKTIEELVGFFNTTPDKFIKSIIYLADEEPVMVVIRGDFEINETKLKNLIKANSLELASEEIIKKVTRAPIGFASPIKLNVKIVADESVLVMKNAISGANKKDYHLKNICYSRDFNADITGDIRKVKSGELCPKCKATLESYRGIEVGHIFKLGYKYTKSMNVKVLGKDGKEFTPIMGCYGIGVGRTMASVIEQNNDEDGIIWPISIAPFHIIVVPINMQDEKLVRTAFSIYEGLSKKYEVLIDDLIGIPIRITVGKTFHENETLEIKIRRKKDKVLVGLTELDKKIEEIYNEEKRLYEV